MAFASSIASVVGPERRDRGDGAEDLLLEGGHLGRHVAQHGRREERAVAGAADESRRARGDRLVDDPLHALDLLLVDDRAESDLARGRVADGEVPRALGQRREVVSAIDSCTRCRLTARQIWPWCRNEPHAPADDAASMSASSSTISGLLPPSSSTVRFSPRPAASPTRRPVFVEPVNEIIRTFGSSTSAWPTSAPPPITCNTPFGQPGLLEDASDDHAAGDRRVRVALEHHRVAERRAPGRASASRARSGSSTA